MRTLALLGSAVAAFAAVAFAVYWSGGSSPESDTLPLPLLEPKVFGRPLTPDVRVMVLIAGYPDTHEVWAHQVRAFADEYHIVSLTTPDYDRASLRRRWGYNFTEVPEMMARSLEAYLGPARRIDVMITHDWGAIWGYYLLQGAAAGRVGRLVAVENGAASHDDPTRAADIPSVAHATLFSASYQVVCASLFAVGAALSPTLAQTLLRAAFSLMPYIGPFPADFDLAVHAPRPLPQVEWWMGYPYYHLWVTHRPAGLPPPRFPAVPTLFLYGARKRTMFHSAAFEERLEGTAGCRVARYEDCSHWLMHEEPERFTEDVRAFLRGDKS